MERTVKNILDLKTGEYINSDDLLSADFVERFKLRNDLERRIQKNESSFVCAICKQKLKLKGGKQTDLYFAHLKDSEDCPIKTDSKFTLEELNCIIYHGLKESDRHIALKNRLFQILLLDKRFSNQKLETVIKDFQLQKQWKKPDAQALYNNQNIVFELQISNTFLSVIVSREIFYERNEIPLIWVFDTFSPQYLKFYECDIFTHHNCNVLVLDDEAYEYSIKSKKLSFKVYYLIPKRNIRTIEPVWCSEPKIIDFSDLKLIDGRAYFYDYTHEAQNIKYGNSINTFFDFIKSNYNINIGTNEFKAQLKSLQIREISCCENDHDIKTVKILICCFLAFKTGKVYGFANQSPIWVINIIHESYKSVFWLVVYYMRKTGIEEQIVKQDSKHLLKEKLITFDSAPPSNDKKFNKLLEILFPEIKGISG